MAERTEKSTRRAAAPPRIALNVVAAIPPSTARALSTGVPAGLVVAAGDSWFVTR